MAEINNKEDLIKAGWGGYEGWGEAEALANYKATGGSGKWDPSIASKLGLELTANKDSLLNEIINVVNGYEDQIANLGVPALTDEEMETFLQKAIDQVSPYYEKKKAEIEAGIKEGKVQSTEDLLVQMREIRADIEDQLSQFDISKAQTDEELTNTLADITSSKEENIEAKRTDWRDRIRSTKETQVKSGTLTSGVGKERVGELLGQQQTEEATIERRAGTDITQAETSAKYDLENITLARESAQRERVRKLGTPEEESSTQGKALAELGYTGIDELPATAEIDRARTERNITTYRPGALTDITEEQKRAEESRKLTLQSEELVQRREKELSQRKKIESEIAKKQREVSLYGLSAEWQLHKKI